MPILRQLASLFNMRSDRGYRGGELGEAPYTKPQINGRNWRRSRNEFARAMRDVSRSLRQIRHASHVRTAQDHAADAAVAVAGALATFNEIVAIAEANDGE